MLEYSLQSASFWPHMFRFKEYVQYQNVSHASVSIFDIDHGRSEAQRSISVHVMQKLNLFQMCPHYCPFLWQAIELQISSFWFSKVLSQTRCSYQWFPHDQTKATKQVDQSNLILSFTKRWTVFRQCLTWLSWPNGIINEIEIPPNHLSGKF